MADGDDKRNSDLYKALMKGDEKEVIKLCETIPDGPLYIMTIHYDTVLHVATYSRHSDLVLRLLEQLPETPQFRQLITVQNDAGNTVLHEAATSNSTIGAAKEMLKKAPELLNLCNGRGETPIFRAARYGKTEVFEFLAGEVEKVCGTNQDVELNKFFRRTDGTTILHISVLAEHFALEAIRREKAGYDLAVKLAELLVPRDASWKDTNPREDRSKPKIHKFGASTSLNEKRSGRDRLSSSLPPGNEEKKGYPGSSQESNKSSFTASGGQREEEDEGKGDDNSHEDDTTPVIKTGETPLFLATMSGIREIVEQILDVHPQAIEHVNAKGRNILHVAIKYRQLEIFDRVVSDDMLARRLVRKTDNWGNSILHMVGEKRSAYVAEKIQNPALQRQEELLLFERVKEVSVAYFIKHFNKQKQTPEELFATTFSGLHKSATDWLKRTSENCIIVAVLIATVAFAAAYTIPGGPNQDTGLPLLLYQPFFVIFTLTDVISLTFALASVVTFLSILTSSFQLQDFKSSLPQKLMLGFTFLILSVSMMMVAFAATVALMIHNKERWTKILLYTVAFLPVSIFAISYSHLYLSLLEACRYPLKLLMKASPRCNCVPLHPWIHNKLFENNGSHEESSSVSQSNHPLV